MYRHRQWRSATHCEPPASRRDCADGRTTTAPRQPLDRGAVRRRARRRASATCSTRRRARSHEQVAFASPGRRRRGGRGRGATRSARGGSPRSPSGRGSCSASASCSTPAPTSWPRSSPPSTARCLSDAQGEVARGLEVVEFACGAPHLLKGQFSEGVSTGVDVYSIRQPLGVVAIISPFNFPAMVPCWFFPLAIAAGNTVDPQAEREGPVGRELARRAVAGGGPPRRASSTSCTATRWPSTGCSSTPTCRRSPSSGRPRSPATSTRPATRFGKRVQALGGAKNHMVVLPDADLDLAGRLGGQRRVRLGRRAVHGDLRGRRRRRRSPTRSSPRSASGSAGLAVGDGRSGADMGPLVTQAHRDKVASYLDAGVDAGRRRSSSTGASTPIDGDAAGLLARPDALRPRHAGDGALHRRDLRARCSPCSAAATYDDALALVNANPYGNGTAIFTNDGGAARRFQNEVEVGMVGINVPIPVPVAYYSFGGLEELALRRHPRARHRGRALLHAGQGRHEPLARPEPRRRQPGLPRSSDRLEPRDRAMRRAERKGTRHDDDAGPGEGDRRGHAPHRAPRPLDQSRAGGHEGSHAPRRRGRRAGDLGRRATRCSAGPAPAASSTRTA